MDYTYEASAMPNPNPHGTPGQIGLVARREPRAATATVIARTVTPSIAANIVGALTEVAEARKVAKAREIGVVNTAYDTIREVLDLLPPSVSLNPTDGDLADLASDIADALEAAGLLK